jgi:LacI family transcriptional regulator
VNEKRSKPVGIKQIAQALNVSIGTVDRALHGRTGVNADTRARVLQAAESLNYRPNVAARNLKLNRKVRLAVHLPRQIASFYDPVRRGIQYAAEEGRGLGVEVDFKTYERFGQEDLDALERDIAAGYDGFILAPGSPGRLKSVLHQIADAGSSTVFVATDAPNSPRLAFVGSDAYVCGCIAAELLAMRLSIPASLAILTGDLLVEDHAEKLRGFTATIATVAPHLHLLPTIESHDDPDIAYHNTLQLLDRDRPPAGLYISTANSIPVLRAIQERGLLGTIKVVASDLFHEMIPMIESGAIFATLHQRPFTQGKLAFEMLTRHLIYGSQPKPITKLPPHIVLQSNLQLFADDGALQAYSADSRIKIDVQNEVS